MASIRKRRNKFNVVYYYTNDQGERKQKWEPFDTEAEAKKRKAEVEYKQQVKTFIPPNKLTVASFLQDYVALYGEKKWSPRTYEANTGLIRNYIAPLIGDMSIQNLDALAADKFISQLQKTECVSVGGRQPKTQYLTPCNIERINRLMKNAFNNAIRWNIVEKNPFVSTILPPIKKVKREIWNSDIIRQALDECKDAKLYVALNLAFACSLRVGEVLGLTWDNIHISDSEIANDDAHLCVEKELARIKLSTIDTLGSEKILKVFPQVMYRKSASTRVVLMLPKTETSIRKVWMPKTVAYILREWQRNQILQKEFLGDEYQDHNLVIALENGRPCETKVIENAFNRLKNSANLPNVVFHSLRHSSTTYKLKLNHGDLKATQGDTGHARIEMITDIYAHILDEDRKVNAQKFEAAFYSNPDLRGVKAPVETQQPAMDIQSLIIQLQQSPELLQTLSALLAVQKA